MRSTRLELDCVSIHHSHLTIHVMSTDEELMIARHTVMPLAAHSGERPSRP
jgi:acetate kinase